LALDLHNRKGATTWSNEVLMKTPKPFIPKPRSPQDAPPRDKVAGRKGIHPKPQDSKEKREQAEKELREFDTSQE
jgi:hypothetical protein